MLSLALREELSIIVNTGDDFRHLGLHISPDLDSVMYALADCPIRSELGRRDETWTFMEAQGLSGELVQLGDGDLAMHVERSCGWRRAV